MLWASLGLATGLGCAPDDPFDFGGPRSCEPVDQNVWVYDLMQEAYLWSAELPAVDPADYDTASELVRDLRVDPDRWSRVSDKERSDALFEEGKVIGLGYRTLRDADQRVVVADVARDSPADRAGIRRGDVIQTVGGLRTAQIDEEERWSEVYGQSEPGVVVQLEVLSPGLRAQPVELVKDWYTIDTVPVHRVLPAPGRPVGYLQLATFVDTAPEALDAAFAEWNEAGVRRVVIDLRYNGGGLVSVARHFIHLLVGSVAEGRMAYGIRYNANFSSENLDREVLRLPHSLRAVEQVVFITTGASLSASELVINAVSAHVPVSIVGDTTGGKPVGSKHFDFCEQVAAPITFRIVNARGVGDYFDGLPPTCAAPDDLTMQLGDAGEASLATALHLLETGECLDLAEGERAAAPWSPGLRTRTDSRADPDRWPTVGLLR
ncbi:MAG: PDZ domain-containing protein [Myxococcales bacterium]|nr:PDZ domain-containing protein [Myxococcales bacterium]